MPLFAEATCPLKREKRSRQTLPVSHGDEMSVALVTSDHSCHWSPAGFILCVNTSLSADVSPQTQSPNIPTSSRHIYTADYWACSVTTRRTLSELGGRSQSSEDSWFWRDSVPVSGSRALMWRRTAPPGGHLLTSPRDLGLLPSGLLIIRFIDLCVIFRHIFWFYFPFKKTDGCFRRVELH